MSKAIVCDFQHRQRCAAALLCGVVFTFVCCSCGVLPTQAARAHRSQGKNRYVLKGSAPQAPPMADR
eukprot:3562721-Pleurochrysis_carterae.AAC.1